MEISEDLRKRLLTAQQNEITEYHIYNRIAAAQKPGHNRTVLEDIAKDELRHSQEWKKYTGEEIGPRWSRVRFFTLISRLFGFTFGVKLMEKGEAGAQLNYAEIARQIPEAIAIHNDEERHEKELLEILDEEALHYAGSMVLGLNDALVELTGALAGFTLALQNVKLIALTGLITGIAASLSMAASEYLSTSAEKSNKKPLKAALYTGVAYVFTVIALILPFLLLEHVFLALGITLAVVVAIIAVFNYYISIAMDENFRRRFLEMAGVSLGVAAVSFLIGFLIRNWLGVDV